MLTWLSLIAGGVEAGFEVAGAVGTLLVTLTEDKVAMGMASPTALSRLDGRTGLNRGEPNAYASEHALTAW